MARQEGRNSTISTWLKGEARRAAEPCAVCRLSKNTNGTISLQIHHKNGDRENDTRSNLEFVCKLCHATRHLKLNTNGQWEHDTSTLTSLDLLAMLDARNPDGGEFIFRFESQWWKILKGEPTIQPCER